MTVLVACTIRSARIAAEAAVSMTKKLLALENNGSASYQNTFSRFVAIKEEQAHLAKEELLVLWTDYFKPHHLEAHPNLHEIFLEGSESLLLCCQSRA